MSKYLFNHTVLNENIINIINSYLLKSLQSIKLNVDVNISQLSYEIAISSMYSPSNPIILSTFDK